MLAGLTFIIFAAIQIVQAKRPLDEDMYLYWRRAEPSECKPFTTYMVACNKCVCSADGIAYCTRMACFSKEEEVVEESEENDHTGLRRHIKKAAIKKETKKQDRRRRHKKRKK